MTNGLDQVAHNGVAGANANAGSVTTTSPQSLVFVAFLHEDGTTIDATAGTGFTMRQKHTSGSQEPIFTQDRFVDTTGVYDGPLTFASSPASGWEGAIATFKLQ